MDEGYFINRDARMAARDLREGDAAGAASLLREDCQHMSPREFSKLIQETSRNSGNCTLADLQIERDGDVVVRSQDGRRFNAGRLPCEEAARFLPPPPPVVIIERQPQYRPPVVVIDRQPQHRPPVVVIERPDQCPPPVIVRRPEVHPQPPVIIIDNNRHDVPRYPSRPFPGQRSEGPSDTVIGAVGGAIIGGVIGDGKGKNGALKGAVIGGTAGAILGHVSDEMKERR